MPCPVCECNIGEADHRMCVYQLLKEGKIKSSKDWEKLAKKPVTKFLGIFIRKIRTSE